MGPTPALLLQSGEVGCRADHLERSQYPPLVGSGAQLVASLGAARGENPATPLGLHPGPEAVLLGTMAFLGLERLLGHGSLGSGR